MSSYQLLKSDGTFLLELSEGVIDNTSTSLSLIGKNVVGFGTALNANLIHLIENFAAEIQPTAPLVGQLWYDTANAALKVYTSDGMFLAVAPQSHPVVDMLSPYHPITLSDSSADNMFVFRNGESDSCAITLPIIDNFPIGATIKIVKVVNSTISIHPSPGVTVFSPLGEVQQGVSLSSGLLKTATLTCISQNIWILQGDIAAIA